jgi:hypothetical protein
MNFNNNEGFDNMWSVFILYNLFSSYFNSCKIIHIENLKIKQNQL